MTSTSKGQWTTARVDGLPDSSFAYVGPGGQKDGEGKTTPRALRHLPYKDEDGQVDAPHLRAALQRLPQTDIPEEVRSRVGAKLERVAGKHGVEVEKYSEDEPRDVDGEALAGHLDRSRSLNAPKKAEKSAGAEVVLLYLKDSHPGSRVQSLVFDKDKYPEAGDAQAWANDHGFTSGQVDDTDGGFRLRQEDPDRFARLRTIALTEGVQAVVGFPKVTVKAVQDAFFLTAGGRLAYKSEALAAAQLEAVEETSSAVVFAVRCAGSETYFAASGGLALALPMYQVHRALAKSRYVPISKSSDEKRYTLGVVYPASKRRAPETDFHGDMMTEDEVEKSAWGFMSKGQDRVGLMHRPGTSGAGRVVESYIYRGPTYTVKDVGGTEQEISTGDWLAGVVWTPDAWEAIKGGSITGYSLQGLARKEAIE